jgi:hypothetical protein
MASKLVNLGQLQAQRVSIDSVKQKKGTSPTDNTVQTPPVPKFDFKKIGVAAGVGIAAFAILKVVRPDSNILPFAGLAIGGVVGYFAYDMISPPKANFNNALGGKDCMTCCRNCKGKCSCTGNMCTCAGTTILMSY